MCGILGKRYSAAQLLRHAYYGGDEGISVLFRGEHGTYSEAFAGSGELAVASLVVQLCSAEPNSLVLLDEPEVSLHPGAQERLLVFLLDEALRHKHQIVFTTHSPGLIRHLPPEAIKVFYKTADGHFDVLAESHPYAAFKRLGAPVPHGLRVLVEDRLAKYIVQLALRELPEEERELFVIDYLPGGAPSYYAHRAPTLMYDSTPTYLLLDGDQEPDQPTPNPDTIPRSEDATLDAIIRTATRGVNVQLAANGGDDLNQQAALTDLRRKYLGFLHARVWFLPRSCPEAIVVHAIEGGSATYTAPQAKAKLAEIVKAKLGSNTAEEIDTYARSRLSDQASNADLKVVANKLKAMLASVRPV